MGGCFSKAAQSSSAAAQSSTRAPAPAGAGLREQDQQLGGSTSSPTSDNAVSSGAGPAAAVKTERRRLSVSESAKCEDNEESDLKRGTTVLLSKAKSEHEIIRSLSSPRAKAVACQKYHTEVWDGPATVAESLEDSVEDDENSQQQQTAVENDARDLGENVKSNRRKKLDGDNDDQQAGGIEVQVGADAKRRKSRDALPDVCNGGINSAEPPRDKRRLSITGCLSQSAQDNFENKKQKMKGTPGTSNLAAMGVGYACKKGLKPESPNQDDFFIVKIDDWGLYGVFDGHGPFGHDVSNYVQKELPRLIYDNEFFWSAPLTALKASFTQVHNMLIGTCENEALDCTLSGSTATVVLHRPTQNKLYVAHVGDSRCVIGRLKSSGKKVEAVNLTIDHKPNHEAEKRRITNAGGQVRKLDGDIPHRVFLKGKLYPGLAMSRAIGDIIGCQAGVIPIPDVLEVNVDPTRDLFLVICSDGVWEFMSSQEAVDVVTEYGFRRVQQAADKLALESWQRWIAEEGNVVDDITVQIVYLFPERYEHA